MLKTAVFQCLEKCYTSLMPYYYVIEATDLSNIEENSQLFPATLKCESGKLIMHRLHLHKTIYSNFKRPI